MISIKSDIISLYGTEESMLGGRSENQDDFGFIDTPIGFLLIVCDGMGGGPGGKMASSTVKNRFASVILNCSPDTPKDFAIKKATNDANDALEELMRENPSLVGMGSTFVAILIDKNSAFIANAGDSRCYQLRNKKVIFQSNDHSLVAELVRNKALTEEEARVSPQSNIITRGLGSTSNHVPEIYEVTFRKGDRFVLCTDGVWGSMPKKDLVSRFTINETPSYIVKTLSVEIDRIGYSKGGGHDNHTLAIIDIDESSTAKSNIFNLQKKYLVGAVTGIAAIILLAAVFFTIHYIQEDEIPKPADELPNSPGISSPSRYTGHNYKEENEDISSGKNDLRSSITDTNVNKVDKISDTITDETNVVTNSSSSNERSSVNSISNNAPSRLKGNHQESLFNSERQRTVLINKIISRLDSAKNVRIPKNTQKQQQKFNRIVKTNLDSISDFIIKYTEIQTSEDIPNAITDTKKFVNNKNGWVSIKDATGDIVLDLKKQEAVNICIDNLNKLRDELQKNKE